MRRCSSESGMRAVALAALTAVVLAAGCDRVGQSQPYAHAIIDSNLLVSEAGIEGGGGYWIDEQNIVVVAQTGQQIHVDGQVQNEWGIFTWQVGRPAQRIGDWRVGYPYYYGDDHLYATTVDRDEAVAGPLDDLKRVPFPGAFGYHEGQFFERFTARWIPAFQHETDIWARALKPEHGWLASPSLPKSPRYPDHTARIRLHRPTGEVKELDLLHEEWAK